MSQGIRTRVELMLHYLPSGSPHAPPELGGFRQCADRIRESFRVPRRDHQTGVMWPDDFTAPPDVRNHDRLLKGHRFQKRPWKSFKERRKHEDV